MYGADKLHSFDFYLSNILTILNFNDLNETRRAITKLCPKGFFEWPAYYTREKLEEILKRTVPLRNWNMMFVMQNICANWKEIFDIK